MAVLPSRRSPAQAPNAELAEAIAVSRFWRCVQVERDPGACWEWLGDRDRNGYGVFQYHGRRRPAHELALSFSTGEQRLPNLDTCHACDNPPCCNPAHLRFDTREANVGDMKRRGRGANGSTRLTAQDVEVIRARRLAGARQVDLAADFGVSGSLISQIVNGKRWKLPATNTQEATNG